jgi:hypothetical protein
MRPLSRKDRHVLWTVQAVRSFIPYKKYKGCKAPLYFFVFFFKSFNSLFFYEKNLGKIKVILKERFK